MAKLPEATIAELADRVVGHLAAQSAVNGTPAGYQFTLPDGRFLTLNDYLIKRNRVLYFYGYAPIAAYRRVSAMVYAPRRVDPESPWFAGWDDKQLRKATKRIRYAIGFAYGGPDRTRVPDMILLDPYADPEKATP
jgi:hypothetical protein